MSTDDGIPDADETEAFYNIANAIIAELWDENFHHGYWDSEADRSSNRQASDKLTDLVIERTGDVSNARLLDVGCGIGLPAFRLAGKSPSVTIVGLSNNRSQIDDANRRSAELDLADRVTFDYADALAMPYEDGSFDVVWVFETLPHLDRAAALQEIHRVLKPGGKVVIADMYLNAQPNEHDLALIHEHEAMTAAAPMLLEHEYREMVAASGLVLDELKDISAETHRTGVIVYEAINERWDELVGRYTEAIIPLLEIFRAPAGRLPEIGYLLATARKAG